jgi:hypothetical protein
VNSPLIPAVCLAVLERGDTAERDVRDQGARDVRLFDTRPSLPPNPLPEAARALLAGAGEGPRRCPNCGQAFTGRAVKQACSGRCRAVLSRWRQSAARAMRDEEVRELLLKALRLLDEAQRVAWRKGRGPASAQGCNPDVGIGPDAPGHPPTHSSEGPR